MKKCIKILMILLLTMLLLGCNIQKTTKEDYIDIEQLYNENKEVIDLKIANMDLKGYADKEGFEYYSNDIYFFGSQFFSFLNKSEINGVTFRYEKMMYYVNRIKCIMMFEMKNEKEAKEVCEKYNFLNSESPLFCEKNVVYWDPVAFNLMTKNYYLEGNNYITLDGNTFITNLSNEEILYIPNVKAVEMYSLWLNSKLKKIYANDSLEKINMYSFWGCFNLEYVYLNEGLKEIDDYAFHYCESLKYAVIPDSVEKIGKGAFTHGTIYCEDLEKPDGWDEQFAYYQAKIYWGNEWEYNEEGVPVVIENSSKK